MERTARLVRIVLAGLPTAPDSSIRGTDVATGVARSGGISGQGAHAAGGRAGVSSRDLAHAVLGAGGIHAAGGPAGVSSRELAHAVPRAGGISGSEGAHAAGGPAGVSSRELAHAVRKVSGKDYSRQGATDDTKGEREAKEQRAEDDAKRGQSQRVGSQAVSGRGLSLAASILTQDTDSGPTPSSASPKVCPMNVHDKSFLSCNKTRDDEFGAIALDDYWSTHINVSDKITSILTNSSGPVGSFRIDSSKWTDDKCLDGWIDLLSEKSVQELVLLNLGHKVTTEFPIQSLRSKDLHIFRIGFMALKLDLLCFNYNSLQILEFFSCALESIKLSWVVTDCLSLKELKVQYCSVDLCIKSNSLKILHSVGNIGKRIVIECAPSLVSLVSGMVPKQQSTLVRQRIPASISLNSVLTLKVIKNLNLPYHKIMVNNKDITKDVGSLPSVEALHLSLEMSSTAQIWNLRKLLDFFPRLQDLSLVRLDGIGTDEGFDIVIEKPFDDICMVHCVNNYLTAFSLLDFRGGSSERHIIQCILKNALNLMRLRTSRCKSASKRGMRDAVKEIKNYDRASEGCQLTFE